MRFKVKDQQDLLAMTALQFVIQNLDLSVQKDQNPIMEQIKELNEEIALLLG